MVFIIIVYYWQLAYLHFYSSPALSQAKIDITRDPCLISGTHCSLLITFVASRCLNF